MKKKILIGYNYILHYRKPMFNLLSEKYDVTILHSGKSINNNTDKYKELIFPVKKHGPFYLQQGLIKEIQVNDYDYVILLFDVRWLNTIRSILKYRKKVKIILWGAWLTNSNLINKIRLYLSKKVYANVFYTHKSRLDFINLGLDETKTYVANNTFDVGERVKSFNNEVKDIILFVGSLDSRKENKVLISAFNNILDKIPESINLIFIGDGDEMINLTNQVNTFQIASRIKFVGRIEDSSELKGYYKRSIVSVSYGQSGLSVLQSLGYGVSFLTKENSISGGEKNNIKHKFNSIFCEDNITSLEYYLTELCLDIKYSRELGKNAFEYYTKYCTIENMSQGFIDSIERTSKTTIDKTLS
jgi:glycosyltransferase involved in cell wall biosynthesis